MHSPRKRAYPKGYREFESPPLRHQRRINNLSSGRTKFGKRLRLRHLSPDCDELLQRAKSMVQVNLFKDPRYQLQTIS
jgi:hypothetical protein